MLVNIIATISNYAFGVLCLGSAAPFLGIPFPRRSTADYYRDKNRWLAARSGGLLTQAQAGIFGAVLRITVGVGVVVEQTREAALLANTAVVIVGTVLAVKDGRPLMPQWTMLGMLAWCLITNRMAHGGS